jgi:PAS domain S-box-containing protein
MKIMVVDNDRVILKFLARRLEKEGHQVKTAEDGLQALDMLMDDTPDVIIVDLIMPNIDGKTLCKIIRNLPKLKNAYLMILSATAAEEKINIAQLGANACIAKGSFDETAKHILAILDQPVLSSSQCLAEQVFGIKNIYPRGITKELLSAKKHFEMVLETITEGILEINAAGRIIYANSTALAMIDIPEENLLGAYFFELFAEDDRKRVTDLMENTNGRDQNISDDNPVSLNGYQVLLNILPLATAGVAAIIILNDLSEQKRTEAALRKTNKFLKDILDSSYSISIISTDLDKNILFWNKGAENIFGYKAEEVVGRQKIDILYPEDEKRRVEQEIRPSILKNKKGKSFEVKEVTRDGRELWLHLNLTPRFDDKDNIIGILGIGEDITERKLTEEALRESEENLARSKKMESLGLMAGGIAHDLNNILSGIVSYPDLLLMDLPEDSPMRKPIETIRESGIRAADVVSDLLTVARGVATGKEVLNLNTIIENYFSSAEHMMIKTLKPSITYQTQLDPDLLNIRGSSSHIKKSLLNLVVNASEAISDHGTVIVSTMNRYLDEPLTGYEHVRQGEYTILSVADNGSGISSNELDRIFEPFYTKKVMGRSGTGLGLTVVWNTVKDHKGYITVNSGEEGTLFELYFPITRDELTVEKEKALFKAYAGHGERILVVDDEANQRKIACGLLSKLGYMVEAVSSGEKAIEYLKEHPVDLIVLDMIMPLGMNGRETYEAAVKIRSNQKAIIASGFSETDDVKAAQELGAGQYVKKPYVLEKIGIAVRDELKR